MGNSCNTFTIKLHHNGKVKTIEAPIPDKVDVCSMKLLTSRYGNPNSIKIQYAIPTEFGVNFKEMVNDSDACDIVSIGSCYGGVEVYFMHDETTTEICGNESMDGDIHHDGKEASENDDDGLTENSESDMSDCESFRDSDYDFDDDDDDTIYEKYVDVDVDDHGEQFADSLGSARTVLQLNASYRNESYILDGKKIDVDDNEDSRVSSDDLQSIYTSSEEESNRSRRKFKKFRASTDMHDPKFDPGTTYDSKMEFKKAVQNYNVNKGRLIRFQKNDKTRLTAKCVVEKCPWKIHASKMENSQTFLLRTLGPDHTCSRSLVLKAVTYTFLSERYLDYVRLNMSIGVGEFQEKIHNDLNVNVSRKKAYRALQSAKKTIYGKYKDQYSMLWDYIEEIQRSNPRSTVEMVTEFDEESSKERFKRLYICLEPLKRGFLLGCRPVVGVDGYHLRGPHPGVLLTAVGLDANNCIYPVVYSVVEAENKDSWSWFLAYLIEVLRIYQSQNQWTFISDRQKGLVPAIAELIPYVEHRHCVRHLHNNFKKLHPGQTLKDRMCACARSTYVKRYENEMEAFKTYDEMAWMWLKENTAPIHWSRSHFRTTSKCDILLNNLCESFNSIILSAREQPILSMLEKIRVYLMTRMQTKRDWMVKQDVVICPKIQLKLEKLKEQSAACIPRFSGNQKFEVTHMYGEQFAVDLQAQTCDCRVWQLSGLPCQHAISALARKSVSPEEVVHNYYTKVAYMQAYDPVICPLNGPNAWNMSDRPPVSAPKKLKLVGRPKKVRRKEASEMQTTADGVKKLSRVGLTKMTCSYCHQKGHNKRRCSKRTEQQPGQQTDAQQPGQQPQQQPGQQPHQQPQQQNDTQQPGQQNDVQQQPQQQPGQPPNESRLFNTNRCARCKKYGHNKRTCTLGINNEQSDPTLL